MMFNYELLEMGIVLREGGNEICKDMIEKAGNWICAELLLYNVLWQGCFSCVLIFLFFFLNVCN